MWAGDPVDGFDNSLVRRSLRLTCPSQSGDQRHAQLGQYRIVGATVEGCGEIADLLVKWGYGHPAVALKQCASKRRLGLEQYVDDALTGRMELVQCTGAYKGPPCGTESNPHLSSA